MSKWTIKLLQRISPDKRLQVAASIFWWSLALGLVSVIFLCNTWFERTLMAISWGAITITCVDLICTTDVRANEKEK